MAAYYSYEINEELEIRAYTPDQEPPFLFQPHHPNNEPWASKEEAVAWIEEFLDQLEKDKIAAEEAIVGKELIEPSTEG